MLGEISLKPLIQVEDDEVREMMKDNGIGRPSTRANIIETLFKRKYIEKKNINLKDELIKFKIKTKKGEQNLPFY